jgi:hypothetical protein
MESVPSLIGTGLHDLHKKYMDHWPSGKYDSNER